MSSAKRLAKEGSRLQRHARSQVYGFGRCRLFFSLSFPILKEALKAKIGGNRRKNCEIRR